VTRALALLAVLLVASPCEAFRWRPARVGVEGPASWQHFTDAALAEWAKCGVVRLSAGEDTHIIVEDYGPTRTWIARTQVTVNSKGIAKVAYVQVNRWWFTDAAPTNYTGEEKRITTHELGHVLGLAHDSTGGVMTPHSLTDTVSQADCDRLRALYR